MLDVVEEKGWEICLEIDAKIELVKMTGNSYTKRVFFIFSHTPQR